MRTIVAALCLLLAFAAPAAAGRSARCRAAHRGDVRLRAGMEGAEGRSRRGQEPLRQRRGVRHRHAGRPQGGAVPERRQHGERRHGLPARARTLRHHRHRGERHRRRRRPGTAHRRCRGGRALGPVSRGRVRARDGRQVPAAALDENALSQLRHDLPDRCRRAQRPGRDGEALLVRGRSRHAGRRGQGSALSSSSAARPSRPA